MKHTKNNIFDFLTKNCCVNCSFAHFCWVTWANCSWLLICHERAIRSWSFFWYERPEQFAHSHSFVLSDLSESLTVPYLIWAKWANMRWANEQMSDEQMSKWAMSKWANEQWAMSDWANEPWANERIFIQSCLFYYSISISISNFMNQRANAMLFIHSLWTNQFIWVIHLKFYSKRWAYFH